MNGHPHSVEPMGCGSDGASPEFRFCRGEPLGEAWPERPVGEADKEQETPRPSPPDVHLPAEVLSLDAPI
jgi:hypothetical protein